MKASEIKADDILYWDPATNWERGSRSPKMARVRVVDPAVRHWQWDGKQYLDQARSTISSMHGILVEEQDAEAAALHHRGARRVATLNSLRGRYEEVAPRVAEARRTLLAGLGDQRELTRKRAEESDRVIAFAADLGVRATALYPHTMLQVPIEQLKTMLMQLNAGGWELPDQLR